jgi:hypothetical protein
VLSQLVDSAYEQTDRDCRRAGRSQLPSGVLLLAKPYRKAALAKLVRQALNPDLSQTPHDGPH